MFEISEKDLLFALAIYQTRAIICRLSPNCFFEAREDSCPKDFNQYVYTPWKLKKNRDGVRKIILWEMEEIKIYAEDFKKCPLLEIRKKLEYESPAFYGELKKIYKEIIADSTGLKKEAEGMIFLSVFLFGFLAIYSANDQEIPHVPVDLIRKLKKREIIEGKRFYREIEENIRGLNPKWHKMLSQKLKNFELDVYSKKSLLSLLNIFTEAVKNNKNLFKLKDVFEEVERILREARSKNHEEKLK